MRAAYNDSDDRAGLRGYVQFNKYTYIHTYIHTYCAVMRNLINIHIYIHTYKGQGTLSLSKNCTSRESVSPLSRLIRGFRNKYH